jgi:hypothetical protein
VSFSVIHIFNFLIPTVASEEFGVSNYNAWEVCLVLVVVFEFSSYLLYRWLR